MKIKIFNTLGRKLEEIEPVSGDEIGVYSCGLTVYDYAHIGNLRKYVFDDLLRRGLIYLGYKVKWVMNITDVGHLTSDADEGEDKIEKGAKREGRNAFDVAEFYERAFIEDVSKLNIKMPDVLCRATGHIDDQINLIRTLEEKGFTYNTNDGVYFDTSKLSDYGKLAGLDIENLREGIRVEKNPQKKNPTDFALWKFSPQGEKRQMEWDSPWGVGFPGWHIECSAMSVKYLGQPFAIHTGGVDHIPVHHTNEIAQSEAAAGKPLAKYWVHSEHLLEEGRKMAKSDGHFIRLKDVVDRGFDPLDLRFFYLRAHYRTKIDFSWSNLEAAKQARSRILDFALKLTNSSNEEEKNYFKLTIEKFDEAIANDLDTPKALEVLFNGITEANKRGFSGAGAREFFKRVEEVLAIGIFQTKLVEKEVESGKSIKGTSDIPEEIFSLAREMSQAKETKDYDASDSMRSEISSRGYTVEEGVDSYLIKINNSIDKMT